MPFPLVKKVVELVSSYSHVGTTAQRFRDLLIHGADGPARAMRQKRQRQAQTFLRSSEVQQLQDDYRAGIPIKALCTRYAIGRETVYAHVRRAGISKRHPKLSSEEVAKAAELYTAGHSLLDVGARLGVANNTIRRALVAQGVAIRPRP